MAKQKLASPRLAIDWRDEASEACSDWQCSLGERSFKLHKIILGGATHGSRFFLGAFNKDFQRRGTDLSELLPTACHEYMELVWDFLYGNDISITCNNVLYLCKIADVLQIDTLMQVVKGSMEEFGRSLAPQLETAFGLQLPFHLIEGLVASSQISHVLATLAKAPRSPELGRILMLCSESVKPQLCIPPAAAPVEVSGCQARFNGAGYCWQFCDARAEDSCRVRVSTLNGHCALGLSLLGAPIDPNSDSIGGFTSCCWGVCLNSGTVYSAGSGDINYIQEPLDFIGNIVRIDIDVSSRQFDFFVETGSTHRHIQTITASFSNGCRLMFTAAACEGTSFEVVP